MTKGKIFFIPVPLGENQAEDVLSGDVFKVVEKIDEYIVENEKTARRFIKKICPDKVQANIKFHILNKRTEESELIAFLSSCLQGNDIGLMSEAGTPGIADPGASIAMLAHRNNIRVVPLVGPSSILLAMMASGMNGQSFAFNGYLPIDKHEKTRALREFEKISQQKSQSQIFIETPYRNNKLLEELCAALSPSTMLCVASNINQTDEIIKTQSVDKWKNTSIDIHKKPTIFIIHKD